MKKLGQHFLKNKTILDTIIGSLELEEGDCVIEIGPGHGELTIPLLSTASDLGCSILSIEKDHSLIATLVELQQKEGKEKFEVREGDALKILPEVVATMVGTTTKNKKFSNYKIVGNIPYYITGKLLRTMSDLENKPAMAVLMIQKEVAERMCAVPPEMNRLAASVQFWAEAEIIAHVPKKDFSPPPEVDSAVILLRSKNIALKKAGESTSNTKKIDPEHYYQTVRGVFAQPRKNLINNIFEMAGKKLSKTEIVGFLKKIGIDPEGRPQNLTIEQITAIALGKLWG
jgi:16S rRNA (adenine1518-N6/adenine1519-N6)-dimethyltransferase